MHHLIELTELYIIYVYVVCVLVHFIPPVFDKVLNDC